MEAPIPITDTTTRAAASRRLSRRSKQWRASINFSALVVSSPHNKSLDDELRTIARPASQNFAHLPPGHPLHSVRAGSAADFSTPFSSETPPTIGEEPPSPAQLKESELEKTAAALNGSAAPGAEIAKEPEPEIAVSSNGMPQGPTNHRASYHHPIPGIYDRAARLYRGSPSAEEVSRAPVSYFAKPSVSPSASVPVAGQGKGLVNSTSTVLMGNEDAEEDESEEDDVVAGKRAARTPEAKEGRKERRGSRLSRFFGRGK